MPAWRRRGRGDERRCASYRPTRAGRGRRNLGQTPRKYHSAVAAIVEDERGSGDPALPDKSGGELRVAALAAQPLGVDSLKDRHKPAAPRLILRDHRIGAVGDLDIAAVLGDADPPPINAFEHGVDVVLQLLQAFA